MAPVAMPCLKGQYCSMQCPVLGESIGVFSPKATYKTSSNIRKYSHQGSSFLVVLDLFLHVLKLKCVVSEDRLYWSLPFQTQTQGSEHCN